MMQIDWSLTGTTASAASVSRIYFLPPVLLEAEVIVHGELPTASMSSERLGCLVCRWELTTTVAVGDSEPRLGDRVPLDAHCAHRTNYQ